MATMNFVRAYTPARIRIESDLELGLEFHPTPAACVTGTHMQV